MDSPLLLALLAPPTVAYTILLALCALYWSMVIIGVADLDGSDGASHGVEGLVGAAKGSGEALDGIVGVAKGSGEALDGAVAAAKGAHADLGDVGVFSKVFSAWRVRGVPVTVSLSLLALAGLFLSTALLDLLRPLLPSVGAQAAAGIGSLIGGGAFARLAASPLAGFFEVRHGTRRAALLGQTATLATGRVNAEFGQAELKDGGAGLLLAVRFDQPNDLKKGDPVLLVHYDAARQAYIVEPLHPPSPAASATPLRTPPQRELS
jgi:hypothetical protein